MTIRSHRLRTLILLQALALAGTVWAGEEARIEAAVEANTGGKVRVSAVAKTPVPGVFEVTSGLEVFYVDSSGRYGFVDGRLVDMKTKRDLTAARLEKLAAIDFHALPLDLAVKTVRGNGKRVLAVFEDPACPVCRSLHKFIAQLPDVTVYAFMYPVVSPDSLAKAQAAWCAPDRVQAWETLMQGGPAPAPAQCDASAIERIVALGDALHIVGTPTMFLEDGRRLVGATPPDQLLAAIEAAARAR